MVMPAFKVKNNLIQVVDYAEALWKELDPDQPFSYKFMDEAFDKVYKSEKDMLHMFQYFFCNRGVNWMFRIVCIIGIHG